MKPPLVLVLTAALLAGCSSQGRSPVVGAVIDRLWPFGGEDDAGTDSAEARGPAVLTRAAVEATGAAMIRGRLVNENARSVLMAATQNGPYVTYVSRFGQSLTLQGTSLITASRGLGYDLLSVASGPADPLVAPRPVENWPRQVNRVYRFPGEGPDGDARRVTCRFAPGEPREVEIVEVVHAGIQVEETCAGDGVAFTNYHLADLKTGFVWRSLQWLGPDQGQIDLEIVEPVTP